MSTTTTNQNQGKAPVLPVAPKGPTAALPYGSGDAEYAPALAYAMVAKLMGQELQLSNALKKMQADESTDAMKSAAEQASDTRSSAAAESIGSSVTGAMAIGQGAGGIGAEAYLTGKRSTIRGQQSEIREKLRTSESTSGVSKDPALKLSDGEKVRLKDEHEELGAQHDDLKGKKDFWHGAIQGVGQFSQAIAKSSSGLAKSNEDAKAALEQADQQSYKQIADEMGSSNQAALQTVNQFTSENFAAATAIRG